MYDKDAQNIGGASLVLAIMSANEGRLSLIPQHELIPEP